MRILIKVGGTLLDDEATRQAMAAQLAAAQVANPQTVVVHGGGKQMTRFLAERNVPLNYSLGDLQADQATLNEVLGRP